MDEKALSIVKERCHVLTEEKKPYSFVIVWKCKALQNWKYIISTVPLIGEGMMFELTYNGDKEEWYLDTYVKFKNEVIAE